MTRDEIVREFRCVADDQRRAGWDDESEMYRTAADMLERDGPSIEALERAFKAADKQAGETYSPDATASIVRGLAQSGSIDRGSFSAYADQSLQGHDTTTHRADDESFEIGEPDEITVAIVPKGAIEQARADERSRIKAALLECRDHARNIEIDDMRAERLGKPVSGGVVTWADIERVLSGGE